MFSKFISRPAMLAAKPSEAAPALQAPSPAPSDASSDALVASAQPSPALSRAPSPTMLTPPAPETTMPTLSTSTAGVISWQVHGRKIALERGDIGKARADVIVTAANAALRGGGGVDAAIHKAAGPRLLEAIRTIGGCPTGEAVLTDAFDLEACDVKYIIHAVGPIWHGGRRDEPQLLAHAYWNSLALAEAHDCESVVLPSISTGVYSYPLHMAAKIALDTVSDFLEDAPEHVCEVRFVLFDAPSWQAFTREAQIQTGAA